MIKIRICIGRFIQRLNCKTLPGNFNLEYFPELDRISSAKGLPLHASDIVGLSYLKFNDALKSKIVAPLLVVTHSEHIVRLAGRMIKDRVLKPEEVQIWFFTGPNPEGPGPSQVFNYSAEGTIPSWLSQWFFLDK